MRKRRRWLLGVFGFLALFLISTGIFISPPVGQALYRSIERESYSFNQESHLHPYLIVYNDVGSGTTSIRKGERLTVTAIKESKGVLSDADKINIRYRREPSINALYVWIVAPANPLLAQKVDFEITVPAVTDIAVHSNGDIRIDGIKSYMALFSNSGAITVTGCEINGNGRFFASKGAIILKGSLSPAANYQFETETGALDITLSDKVPFHVKAQTAGKITTDFPDMTVEQTTGVGAKLDAQTGEKPQAEVTLNTKTGPISLRKGS